MTCMFVVHHSDILARFALFDWLYLIVCDLVLKAFLHDKSLALEGSLCVNISSRSLVERGTDLGESLLFHFLALEPVIRQKHCICRDVIESVFPEFAFPPVQMSYGVFCIFRFGWEVEFKITIDEICQCMLVFDSLW